MAFITHPSDALALLRKEFPTADVKYVRGDTGRICGYEFKAGRSRHFARMERGGGVDYQSFRLFLDCAVYARDKATAKPKNNLSRRIDDVS